jgi:DNA polymerase I-like protein with 3'-5' exonuclease and polymerase domains
VDDRPPQERDPVWFYENISIPLKRALLRMEANGFALDLEYLRETASEWGVKVLEAEQEIRECAGDGELNPGSTDQLTAAFEKLGVTLESTDEDHLQRVITQYGGPTGYDQATALAMLAQAVLDWRRAKKLYQTYLIGLMEIQRDGIAHPNFNDDAAKTGRMSSSTAKE